MEIKFDRKKINYLMLDNGIPSQAELARRMGVAGNSVSMWLDGATFTSTSLGHFCEVLKCTPNDILEYGAMEAKPQDWPY